MMRLGDFPAVCVIPGGHDRLPPPTAFADARLVASGIADAVREASAAARAAHVVVIDNHVTPAGAAEEFLVEPLLVDSRLCLGFPSRSAVTGLSVARGLRLVPVDRLGDDEVLPEPTLIVPRFAGTFAANETPQRAFRVSHALAAATPLPPADATRARNRLALSASLGAEVLNGCWWILGALSALLDREPVEASWAASEALLSDPREVPRRIRELSRLVRLERQIPVRPLDRRQSQTAKRMLPQTAPPDVWQRFVSGCAELGREGEALAARYRQAGELIWAGELRGSDITG